MAKLSKLPAPITILAMVIIISAIATWLMPAGEYSKLSYANNAFTLSSHGVDKALPATQRTLDSLKVLIPLAKFQSGDIRKPVAVPGSYHLLKVKNSQGPVNTLQAPIKGLLDAADIIIFILIIGGFMAVFQQTGAMDQGIRYLSYKMKGREAWLIITLTFFFSFCGSSYGMAEEALVFYPVLVPLYLAAGYRSAGARCRYLRRYAVGFLVIVLQPFFCNYCLKRCRYQLDRRLIERILVFAITTAVTIWYIVRYAERCKKDPTYSLVHRFNGDQPSPFAHELPTDNATVTLGWRNVGLLLIFVATLFGMIAGVIWRGWWMTEMSAIYLAGALLVAFIVRMNQSDFVTHFVEGAKNLLGVAFIVGIARGITIILNDGHVSDSILYYSANLVGGMPPVLFIIVLFLLYTCSCYLSPHHRVWLYSPCPSSVRWRQ